MDKSISMADNGWFGMKEVAAFAKAVVAVLDDVVFFGDTTN